MSHATEDNAEKYYSCAKEIPKIIVTTAEGHQGVYDPGSKLEDPYGASWKHMTALAGQWHGLSDPGFSYGVPDEMMIS